MTSIYKVIAKCKVVDTKTNAQIFTEQHSAVSSTDVGYLLKETKQYMFMMVFNKINYDAKINKSNLLLKFKFDIFKNNNLLKSIKIKKDWTSFEKYMHPPVTSNSINSDLNKKTNITDTSSDNSSSMKNMDTIFIVCDELTSYHNLPENIRLLLPGYQAFRKIGIDFTNIHNNRQDCSPSRSSLLTSYLDTQVSDNIDQTWQYVAVPNLPTNLDTIGKSYKKNDMKTAYYGKNHIQSLFTNDGNTLSSFNTNTRESMKEYGFDIFNTYGDSYYCNNGGYFSDNIAFNIKVNDSLNEVDYEDSTGKYIGMLPFLKQRKEDKKPYFLTCQFENPHDTQNFWNNLAKMPTSVIFQYWMPYIDEQIAYIKKQDPTSSVYNPFKFITEDDKTYIKNTNLSTNYFENTFNQYVNSLTSLPFLESYLFDYAMDPKLNTMFPAFVGFCQSFVSTNTFPTNQTDLKSWKNLINNYYGLIIECDLYVFKIYEYLEKNNLLGTTSVIISSDHGDLMSSHGMKQKGFQYNECVNVACLIYSPHLHKNLIGTQSSVLGSLLDIAPTLEVLSNLTEKSSRFLGNSLIYWEDNKLHIRSDNNPVFQIVNSWMQYFTYFNYKHWYSFQSETAQNRVSYNPSNLYNFLGFYTMTIDIIDEKQYKLVRYYNYMELLLYNYAFNEKLKLIKFTVDYIMKNISENILKNKLYDSDITDLHSYLNEHFESNAFDFMDLYKLFQHQSDSTIYFILISSIVNITYFSVEFILLIPGYYIENDPKYAPFNTFLSYFNDSDKNYAFFLYNMTDDKGETINLLDKGIPNRITPENLILASKLNNNLNKLIDKYKIKKFNYITADLINLSFLYTIKTYGTDYSSYSDNTLMWASRGYGMTTRDGMFNRDQTYKTVLKLNQ